MIPVDGSSDSCFSCSADFLAGRRTCAHDAGHVSLPVPQACKLPVLQSVAGEQRREPHQHTSRQYMIGGGNMCLRVLSVAGHNSFLDFFYSSILTFSSWLEEARVCTGTLSVAAKSSLLRHLTPTPEHLC